MTDAAIAQTEALFAFSDLQADIARELIQRGVMVFEGVRQLHYLIARSVNAEVEPHLAPAEAVDLDAGVGSSQAC